MKKSIIASISLFAVAFFMTIAGIVIGINDSNTKFSGDVVINGSDVRGQTVSVATETVTQKLNNDLDGIDIKILYKDKVWEFTRDDFEIDEAVKNVVNTAFKTNKISNREAVGFVANKTGNFKTAINEVFTNFDQKIDEIVDEINTDPIDATVEFRPNSADMFLIKDGEYGVKVDREKLVSDLESQFLKQKNILINVKTNSVAPKITREYFDDKLELQSKFSTSIKGSQAGRRNNVKVALQKVNGTVVKPNEIVSFNEITSPQDETGGYQNAIIIMNGSFVNGMGGGICQASTTLYNALVLANLEIDEVHKHTLPVGYVEHALDAMVSFGYADLIFKNTSESDVYIKSYVDGDDAIVEIYGKTLPDGITIKRVAEETIIPHEGDKVILDTNGEYSNKVIYKGEYYRLKWPAQGYDAKAYKEYYKGDKLIKREEIRHEKYLPQEGVVIEGSQELPEGFVLPEQDVTIYPPQLEQ